MAKDANFIQLNKISLLVNCQNKNFLSEATCQFIQQSIDSGESCLLFGS
jgi:hypothetical protein